ncbi:MAG: AAA family ATPase [Candidatus Saccharimonadales bacterium]
MIKSITLHPRSEQLVEKIIEKMPQGLIIDGPTGIGVLTVAKMIAGKLGAQSFILQPKKKRNGEFVVDHFEGNIIIEDIRKLYEQTRTKQPNKQIYIIDTGEQSMTHSAQNAFLKLLEEPRSDVHFIIATHQFNQLLPTIVSRSLRLPLLPITLEQTNKFIESLQIGDKTKKTRLAFVGQGLPALMTHLANNDKLYNDRVIIMQDAKTMINGSPLEKFTVINRYRENRTDSIMLIDDMNHQLRTALRSRPDTRIVQTIEKNLDVRGRLSVGGNIRIQLVTSVL